MKKENTAEIACKCTRCRIVLNCVTPSLSLLCTCEDCRNALEWGFINGGAAPNIIPELFYVRSDIKTFQGLEFMKPIQIRDNARSTRVYCIKCFSILGVDHPGYKNNVFMFFKGHCSTTCDLSIKPSAAIHLKDFPGDRILELPKNIKQIWSFTSDEVIKFRSIPNVAKTLRDPIQPAEGITFQEIIQRMPEIEVLKPATK